MKFASIFLEVHWAYDIIYWLVFALGQFLFLLKRADLARKSPLNGVPTIKAFFELNWVTIIYRSIVEFGLVLYPYRHLDINEIIGKIGWHLPFTIPQSVVIAFFLGLFSDYIMDWFAMQDTVAGFKVPKFLKESIPQLPEVKQLVENMAAVKQANIAVDKAQEDANKAVDSADKAQDAVDKIKDK